MDVTEGEWYAAGRAIHSNGDSAHPGLLVGVTALTGSEFVGAQRRAENNAKMMAQSKAMYKLLLYVLAHVHIEEGPFKQEVAAVLAKIR
jgi:hypothetical protein